MSPFKTFLNIVAAMLRLLSKAVSNWPWVALIVCILSPISPHISTGFVTGYTCDYVGTRGVITKIDNQPCRPFVILNTNTGEALKW